MDLIRDAESGSWIKKAPDLGSRSVAAVWHCRFSALFSSVMSVIPSLFIISCKLPPLRPSLVCPQILKRFFNFFRVCNWHLSYRARIRPGRILRIFNWRWHPCELMRLGHRENEIKSADRTPCLSERPVSAVKWYYSHSASPPTGRHFDISFCRKTVTWYSVA
jgi:hypothetical protein